MEVCCVAARPVFVCGFVIVVASVFVGASFDFQFVTYSVLIDVRQARSVTIQERFSGVGASAVVDEGLRHVIACIGILTTRDVV